MHLLIGALLLVTQQPQTPQDSTALPRDAYMDESARQLVERARERRRLFDRSIQRYQAVAQERISAGLRVVARDRLLFRRETAARIDWQRDSLVHIDVLGARETIPPVLEGVQLPAALGRSVAHLAFDPAGNEMLVRMDTSFMHHPLDRGSESHYRFRSGDTTTIRLQDGRELRLFELVVEPRRRDPDLISGSFWLDAETFGVVRMVFRPARPWEFSRDAERTRDDDDDDMPAWLSVTAELSYVTVEYGLFDLRWWLPRLVSAEGVISMSSMVRMPLSYERRYSEYKVEGDPAEPVPVALTDSARRAARRCRQPMRIIVAVGENREQRAEQRIERYDSIRARRQGADTTGEGGLRRRCQRAYEIVVPADTAALLTNSYLPPSIFTDGAALATEAEVRELADRLGQLPEVPWQLALPQVKLPFSGGGVRYNRIEALSLGTRGNLDLGRVQLDGSVRIGIADRVPNAEAGITRATRAREIRLAGYRRLVAADPRLRPFSLGNSVSAFFFSRDEGDYFRTLGAELAIKPPALETQWYELRLFAERQREATVETDFSIAHLMNRERAFRPNIAALPADQVGARLVLRTFRGTNPAAPRWGAELEVEGASGTFDYVRPALTLRGDVPLLFGLTASLEAAGGRAYGDVPIQSAYFLGSTPTLRGYYPLAATGDAFWRTRAELAHGSPAARFIVFSDMGWAGPRDEIERGRALLSAGAGFSTLDGLLRIDLARATRAPTSWRLHFYLNAAL